MQNAVAIPIALFHRESEAWQGVPRSHSAPHRCRYSCNLKLAEYGGGAQVPPPTCQLFPIFFERSPPLWILLFSFRNKEQCRNSPWGMLSNTGSILRSFVWGCHPCIVFGIIFPSIHQILSMNNKSGAVITSTSHKLTNRKSSWPLCVCIHQSLLESRGESVVIHHGKTKVTSLSKVSQDV